MAARRPIAATPFNMAESWQTRPGLVKQVIRNLDEGGWPESVFALEFGRHRGPVHGSDMGADAARSGRGNGRTLITFSQDLPSQPFRVELVAL